MSTETSDLLLRTQAELESYWEHASENMETHTNQSLREILAILSAFVKQADRLLGDKDVKNAFDRLVAETFQKLHVLNASHGEQLLETDEREMIVPLFDEVAKALGIDLNAYEYGDVTLAVRDF